jgi:hypothetical protein
MPCTQTRGIMTVCRIARALGRLESCPESACPFWAGERCSLDELDLAGRRDLALLLLGVRDELEDAAGRDAFYRRLNADESD